MNNVTIAQGVIVKQAISKFSCSPGKLYVCVYIYLYCPDGYSNLLIEDLENSGIRKVSCKWLF